MAEIREVYQADEVNALKLEIACSNLAILEAPEKETLRVKAEFDDEDECRVSLENQVLVIRTERKRKWFTKREKEVRIAIWIPKGKKFTEIRFQLGAGTADFSRAVLCCCRMRAETGAGSILAGRVEAQENLDIEIGAGNVKIESAVVRDVKIDCGVGNCSLGIEGKQSDYNYDISCGIGKVRINNSSISRIGVGENLRNENATGMVKLNCGVGEIQITTTE